MDAVIKQISVEPVLISTLLMEEARFLNTKIRNRYYCASILNWIQLCRRGSTEKQRQSHDKDVIYLQSFFKRSNTLRWDG